MHIFMGLFIGVFLSVLVSGQSSTGRIAGTITDPSGAVVEGAAVKVVNERTNQVRSTMTNEDGNYVFTSLEPSNYTLSASQPGFAEIDVRELPLQVGQEVRRDVQLSVGTTSSVVNVEGGAIEAAAEPTTISSLADARIKRM